MNGKINLVLPVLFLLIILHVKLNAQLELPRISQKASVTQIIGLTEVVISYSRPNVKDREIWGNLVHYGEIWRTGADEATTITFGDDVKINGVNLAAGKYSFFTIPGRDEWTIIFNGIPKQWGAFNYDSTKDVLRIKVKPEQHEFTESLEYSFSDVTVNSGIVNIDWERIRVPFKIDFNVDKKAYLNIKKAFEDAKPDDWVMYSVAANYAVDNNIHLDEAMGWIDKSISIKGTYYNYYVKARLLGRLGKTKEALQFIEKSRTSGKGDPEFKSFVPQLDKLAADLKENKG